MKMSNNVPLSIQENRNMTTRQLAAEHEISQSSVVRNLKAQNIHPYKIVILQELTD